MTAVHFELLTVVNSVATQLTVAFSIPFTVRQLKSLAENPIDRFSLRMNVALRNRYGTVSCDPREREYVTARSFS
jgi:hypothetical protein